MYVNNIEPEMVLPPGSESFNHNATRTTSLRSRSNNVNNNTVCVYTIPIYGKESLKKAVLINIGLHFQIGGRS